MRLINADKIIVNTFRQNQVDGYKLWRTDFDGLLNIIDEQPTVDVLDKIRAEIEQYRNSNCPIISVKTALAIIDKYREKVSE